jgi:ABC-type hemin transport system substrate-binding protein
MSGLVEKADASMHAAGVHGAAFLARRIISLVPSATSTLHAIGAGEQVVGRTDFDCEEWVADRPSVGGGLEVPFKFI